MNPNLRVLKIPNNKFNSSDQLANLSSALAGNKTLRVLDLDNTPISNEFFKFLEVNNTLKQLRLKVFQHAIPHLLSSLVENKGLEVLDILNQRYSDDVIAQIREV